MRDVVPPATVSTMAVQPVSSNCELEAALAVSVKPVPEVSLTASV